MSRTHVTYLAMLAVFGAGLWGILRAGAALPAARDIAGDWQIAWRKAQLGGSLPDRMWIDQSGRYVVATLRRDGQPVARLAGQLRSDRLGVRANDRPWEMDAALEPTAAVLRRR